MTRYGMLINISKCNGCYNCFLACKDEHCGNDFLPYAVSQPMTGHFWMNIIEKERGQYPKLKVAYTPVMCMHCDNPSCVKMAPDGAIYQRKDGIVIIDPIKAAGRKDLVSSCPYRVIYWNAEKQVPQKCTMCAHLLDQGWKEPRCVEACPTGALLFGDLDDHKSEISLVLAASRTEILHEEYKMQEKVRYLSLSKTFVAGSVVLGDNDECGEGIKVTLTGDGDNKSVFTDTFGDFEFDGLPRDKNYQVLVEAKGYINQELAVKTNVDIYLGDIFINPL